MNCTKSRAAVGAAAWILTMVLGVMDCAAQEPPPNAPPDGFEALFNGRDLSGWFGRATKDPRELAKLSPEALAAHHAKTHAQLLKHWRVESGELVNDGKGLYASTTRDHADFELTLDYRTVAGADSGVYLRGCPQVQIWDTTEAGGKWKLGADKGSGGLWNNKPGTPGRDPLRKMDRAFGEWNRLRVIMVGSRVWVWLNGGLTVGGATLQNYFDRSIPVPRRGPIQLQTHGGEIRWRNVFAREIGAEEANRRLRERGAVGFESLFNRRDFTGWRNPKGYVIEDGAIVCTPEGRTVFTEKQYDDYVLEFEFKLAPGGNNGLAIHYPGRGNAAHDGVELQILDNSAPKYAKLMRWQYHGSAYGIKPARRGFQRPVGAWNHQRVTCRGSRVRVELNGFEILDVDLATQKPADGKPHPGAKRRSGHIGFFGHGDRVAFRNIGLRRLTASDTK